LPFISEQPLSGIEHQLQEKTPSRYQPKRGFDEKSEF